MDAKAEAEGEARGQPEAKPPAKKAEEAKPEPKVAEKKPSRFKGPLKALQAKRKQALADRDPRRWPMCEYASRNTSDEKGVLRRIPRRKGNASDASRCRFRPPRCPAPGPKCKREDPTHHRESGFRVISFFKNSGVDFLDLKRLGSLPRFRLLFYERPYRFHRPTDSPSATLQRSQHLRRARRSGWTNRSYRSR